MFLEEIKNKYMNDILKKIIKDLDKYAGKIFGLDLIISEDKDNKDYIDGFQAGKQFLKDEIKKIIKNYECFQCKNHFKKEELSIPQNQKLSHIKICQDCLEDIMSGKVILNLE